MEFERTDETFLTIPNNQVLNVYRSLQLVFKRGGEVMSIAFLGQHFVMAVLLVLCAFSTIKFWGAHNFQSIPAFISYAVFPGGVLVCFNWIILVQALAAVVRAGSAEFRIRWKRHLRGGTMRDLETQKLAKSFHELLVNVGPFFHYKGSAMPNLLDECVDKIILLLLGA